MEEIKCYCGHTITCDCAPLQKQTAVEWFQDQIIKIVNGTCKLSEIQIFEQAKEMEKDQIMNSWAKGVTSEGNMTSEQYYNETFNKE